MTGSSRSEPLVVAPTGPLVAAQAQRRLAMAALNLLLALVGAALWLEPGIGEPAARVHSLVAAGAALASAWWLDRRVSNWALWFFFAYFALYEAGNLAGAVVLGLDATVLDYPTTFANGIAVEARAAAYFLSGLAASVLGALHALVPVSAVRRLPPPSPRLERWARLAVLVSAPVCAGIYVADAWLLARVGYAALYSAEFRNISADVPLRGLWTNLNTVGWALWFAAVPRERTFKWMAPLFVGLALLDSLKGARILLLVPVAFVLWYRAYVFGHDRFSRTAKVAVAGFAVAFAFGVEVLRQEGGGAVEALTGFLIFSVSKAQHTLALFLDNRATLDETQAFWAAPLRFPLTYLLHGSSVVGQSVASAGLRGDLGHVLSSRLNFGAYIAGAGTGSSLVAEAAQYGAFAMIALLALFYGGYRWYFSRLYRRGFLLLAPLVFQQLVFSPRDTMFPNTWGFVKLLALLVAVYLASGLVDALTTSPADRRRRGPVAT